MPTYEPGSFFVVEVTGWAGAAIYLAQFLARSQSVYGHAGVIVDADGTAVEAAPGGAFLGNISAYAGRAMLISDAPVQEEIARRMTSAPGVNPSEWEPIVRGKVAVSAQTLIGTPYSALDYLALAALHLHLPSRWIRQRVESSGHLICSALCDRAYQRAGIELFDDGRLPGDVMPADLAAWIEDRP